MEESHVLDATSGRILKPLIAFSLPIMLANIIQLLFNAADIIVVGQFVDETAVAAVGSTGSIISILVSLFTGLSVGATVVISTRLGEGAKDLHSLVQTTYTLGVGLGVFTAVIGFVFAPFLLNIMDTPADIIRQADTYLKIYFLGQPGFMIYTFARAILAAKGDTKSPFNYLLLAGVVNVILNIALVTFVDMGVAGVAIATITSQYLSAILTVRKLTHTGGMFHVEIKELHLEGQELKRIVRLGLPTVLQSTLVAVSGILTQSSFNSLGTAVVAGQSASNNIMSFVSQSLNAFSQGGMTFAGQNYGFGNIERVQKVHRSTILIDLLLGSAFGIFVITFGESLLRIYTPDSEASVMAGMVGLTTTMTFAVLLGIQDASGFILRGIGYSVFPMITGILGNCVFRVFWIVAVFKKLAPTLEILSAYRLLVLAYPIAWVIISVANTIVYAIVIRKNKKQYVN